MANCPLCGEKGDDLIFKFYCSNKECANFVSECVEKQDRVIKSGERKDNSINPRFGLWEDCCDLRETYNLFSRCAVSLETIFNCFRIPKEWLTK